MGRSGLQRELTKNQKIEAAINNEALTRDRVGRLENRVGLLEARATQHDSVLMVHDTRGGFWGRLRWLLRGR